MREKFGYHRRRFFCVLWRRFVCAFTSIGQFQLGEKSKSFFLCLCEWKVFENRKRQRTWYDVGNSIHTGKSHFTKHRQTKMKLYSWYGKLKQLPTIFNLVDVERSNMVGFTMNRSGIAKNGIVHNNRICQFCWSRGRIGRMMMMVDGIANK